MSRLFAWLLVALALPALLGACAREPAPTARPALWRATDGDTVIWLFGTIHLLPKDERWLAGPIAKAVADSDTLITEIPAGDPQAQAAAFLKLARADGLPPLAARLAPEQRNALAVTIQTAGASAAALDRMHTWAAALVLGAGVTKSLGGIREAAPETVLAEQFKGRHQAFETFDGQLGIIAGLPERAQLRLLEATVRDGAALGAEFGQIVSAWRVGEPAMIEQAFNASFAGMPELRSTLLTDRNRAWADDLVRRARRPGTLLVAVGAGHMVGDDGLPALLSARGFRVARVQ